MEEQEQFNDFSHQLTQILNKKKIEIEFCP